ncbi:MAG: hypothetical protein QM692_09245 [Thermomicrobiales bacterium]
MAKTVAQMLKEQVNQLEDWVIEVLSEGDYSRAELWRRTKSPDVCSTDYERVLNRLRRAGAIRFSGKAEPSQLIALSLDWR